MRFAIFPVHLSKVLCLPRKSDARSYEVLHMSRKIISANLKIWCSKMQPLSGNQRPDRLTALMNMSLVVRLPRKMHLCRSSSKVPCLPSFFEMLQNPHVLLTFDKIDNPLHLPRGTTSEHPKVVRTPGVFNILTSKCASRHNGVHFFDIWTSKSGPNLVCFVHFDLEMCLAPQRRAIFRHLNFQKWSEREVFFPTCQVRVVRFYQSCSLPPRPALLFLLLLRLLVCLLPLLFHFHVHCCLANSSPSSSPTSELSVHRWTSTWDLPSSVCTAGPQPGTCPAQCAPLDLNLGPSQLSVHRWTSTWDLPSAVCTAGPQPGTCPAQCAPLDLNLDPAQLSVHRWTSAR